MSADATLTPRGVDTHCHLFLLDDAEAAKRTARAVGVDRFVCVGIDVETSRRSLGFARDDAEVFATAGLHPNSATEWDADAARAIEELAADPRVIGIGETGLDAFRMGAPMDVQERVFRAQMAIAREASIPLVIHVRDAWPRMLELLAEGGAEGTVLHCFSGDPTIARECAARGYFLSFAANITYPKNGHLREAAAVVPLDRLLTETDSPFLAPQDRRGTDNAPEHAATVARAIAEVRGADPGEVQAATAANALRAFGRLR